MAEHNEIGKIGENLATTFLMKQGFAILERNYRVKVGEIDIIAQKDNTLHFVEVKSIKVRDLNQIESSVIKPEDNLSFAKWSKLLLAIAAYKKHHSVPYETPEQIDLACVYVDMEKREGRVKLVQNVRKEKE